MKITQIFFNTIASLATTCLPIQAIAQQMPQPLMNAPVQTVEPQIFLYVNPELGSDTTTATGSQEAPYRTISYALDLAKPGTTIILAAGEYSAETFPLVLKSGITVQGDESLQGKGIVILGGGSYLSRTESRQNVTVVAQENAQILGVTITNPNNRGTGIWVESGKSVIRNNTLANSKREGIFVSGKAAPRIENNRFFNNDANGVSITRQAQGEILNNIFENTGFGITIGGTSMPVISGNQIRSCRNGIVLTDAARPKISLNAIENNREYGLVTIGQPQPTLERNTFRGNQKQDQFKLSATPR